MLPVVVDCAHAHSIEDWKSYALNRFWFGNYFLPRIYPARYRLRSGARAVCHEVILIPRGPCNPSKRFLEAPIMVEFLQHIANISHSAFPTAELYPTLFPSYWARATSMRVSPPVLATYITSD